MNGAGHQVVIMAPTLDGAPALQGKVATGLPDNLVVHDWSVLQPGLKQAIQADMSSAFFMYGILVILVAFSVLNTQLMSVLERTHEFGVVMALGMKPGRLPTPGAQAPSQRRTQRHRRCPRRPAIPAGMLR